VNKSEAKKPQLLNIPNQENNPDKPSTCLALNTATPSRKLRALEPTSASYLREVLYDNKRTIQIKRLFKKLNSVE
jgi:hypothetical protein